jgi:hypothetical protein
VADDGWLPVSEALEAAWEQAQKTASPDDAMAGLAIFVALAVRNACEDGDLRAAMAAFCAEATTQAEALFHPDGTPRVDLSDPPVN